MALKLAVTPVGRVEAITPSLTAPAKYEGLMLTVVRAVLLVAVLAIVVGLTEML